MTSSVLVKRFLVLVLMAPFAGKPQAVPARILSGEVIPIASLRYPATINVFPEHNIIIIGDAAAAFGTPVFHVFSIDSVKPIRSFMNLGLGENQVSGPSDIQYDRRKREIAFFDFNMQRYSFLSIDSVRRAKSTVKVLRYAGTKTPFTRPVYKKDQKLSRPLLLSRSQVIVDFNTDDVSSSDLLSIYDESGKFVKHAGKIPFVGEITGLDDQDGPFSGNLALADNEEYIVYTAFKQNIICLFDQKGQLAASYKGSPDLIGNQQNGGFSEGQSWGYISRSVRMKGRSVFAINANPPKSGKTNMYIFNEALVPQERLMINPGLISFDVDPKTRKIYGLNSKKELIIVSY